MANCLTCIHQEVCKERMAIFNLPNVACQYEAHELVGEWVEVKRYNRKGKRFLDCSVCHYGKKGEIVCEVTKIPNFCPNCGANMRKMVLDEAIDGEGKDGNVKEGDEK